MGVIAVSALVVEVIFESGSSEVSLHGNLFLIDSNPVFRDFMDCIIIRIIIFLVNFLCR